MFLYERPLTFNLGKFGKPAEYYTGMRSNCKEAVDIVVNYLENVENFKPFPKVQPGFLVPQIPSDPPKDGVTMQEIFKDVDRLLISGVNFRFLSLKALDIF